jgi:hypothetical protein
LSLGFRPRCVKRDRTGTPIRLRRMTILPTAFPAQTAFSEAIAFTVKSSPTSDNAFEMSLKIEQI